MYFAYKLSSFIWYEDIFQSIIIELSNTIVV
jgi:hypothetical protein